MDGVNAVERCSQEISQLRDVVSKCKKDLQLVHDEKMRALLYTEIQCHLKSLENLNNFQSVLIKDLECPRSDVSVSVRTNRPCCRSGQESAALRQRHNSSTHGLGSNTGSIPFHVWQHIIELEIPQYGKDHAVILGRIAGTCAGLRQLCTDCWDADRARPQSTGSVWLAPGECVGHGVLKQPWGVAVDRDGRILVADRGHHRVVVFAAPGVVVPLAPDPATCRNRPFQRACADPRPSRCPPTVSNRFQLRPRLAPPPRPSTPALLPTVATLHSPCTFPARVPTRPRKPHPPTLLLRTGGGGGGGGSGWGRGGGGGGGVAGS